MALGHSLRMNTLIDIARWVFHDRVDWALMLLCVVLGAWLQHLANPRRTQVYDAWWDFNVDRKLQARASRNKPV
jgi:hypothetical protein